MPTVTLALHAMATRFEMVLHGPNPVSLRAAGEEAFREVEALEARLSLFRPTSEIARANLLAARQPVRLSPGVFDLLLHAQKIWRETAGAFDITIAPLLRAWGFLGATGSWPTEHAIARALDQTGMQWVTLDEKERTVRFEREGIMLDLGAIGKGCAIDAAVEILREAGVQSGLVHGGTSTVFALGAPPNAEHWAVAVQPPRREHLGSAPDAPGLQAITPDAAETAKGCAVVPLRDESLSVSAVSGKWFEHEGKHYGHILDPRTGRPAQAAVISALVLPTATETDALSTALLVGGLEQFASLSQLRSPMRCMVVGVKDGNWSVKSAGMEWRLNA